MVQINIYYSIRKNENNLPTLKFFVDEDCANLDQAFFKFWESPVYGCFLVDIKGSAYIDQVTTRDEYILELENMTNPPYGLIQKLRR